MLLLKNVLVYGYHLTQTVFDIGWIERLRVYEKSLYANWENQHCPNIENNKASRRVTIKLLQVVASLESPPRGKLCLWVGLSR